MADRNEGLVPYIEYDPDLPEIGCCNCDGGWKHGCCDDLCYACNEPQWCENAISCRHCNPDGLFDG
jgi:hypothetical protein